jgi:DNA-binding beta-propeller fold protein YncE
MPNPQEALSKAKTVFRLTDLEYTNSHVDDKIIGIFRFEPPVGSKNNQILIVLAEIEGVGYAYDQLIDTVNNEAEHSRALLSGIEHEPVSRFEKVIQNINNAIHQFLSQEAAPLNWNRINLFILELSDSHMCMAGHGQLMNMFLQKQSDGSFKTYDLFGSLDQEIDVHPEKVFSNIICGDFKAGDMLIAGSRNFERLRHDLRLKERLTTLPPVTAVHEIRQELEHRGIPDDFVATLITCREIETAVQVETEPKETSTASIERLLKTEAETLRHLAPSIARKEQQTEFKEPRAPRLGGNILTNIIELIRKPFRKERIHDVASMVNLRGMHAGFGSFLSRKKKTVVISTIATILVILVAVLLIKHQRNVAAERTAWNSSYDQVKASIDQADGERQYDETKARATIADALTKLDELDTSTQSRKDAVAQLKKQTDEVRTKLKRVTDIQSPNAIYSLQEGLADHSLLSPIFYQGKIVIADRANKKITVVDPTSKQTKDIKLPEGSSPPVMLAAGKSTVIIRLENGEYLAANLETSETSSVKVGSSDAQSVSDLTTYANRLYVLDSKGQQIWKFSSASGGFGNGSKYIQAVSANLSTATSLAIDSNVYVLSENGNLSRFFNGGQDGFALSTIDPPLQHGDQVWADTDYGNIVVSDSQEKRVVIFTKEGRLVQQFTSSAFKGPTDVTGDPKGKKLYVIDGNKLYELLLP